MLSLQPSDSFPTRILFGFLRPLTSTVTPTTRSVGSNENRLDVNKDIVASGHGIVSEIFERLAF